MTDPRDLSHQQRLDPKELTTARYLLLRTTRTDRSPVDTPIWFAIEGDTIWFRTKTATAKVRRLRATPLVELRVCNWKGATKSATAFRGVAFEPEAPESARAFELLKARYGWQWNVVPMIPIPGVRNGHQDLPWRERWRRAHQHGLWPDSSIIGIKLTATESRQQPTAPSTSSRMRSACPL